MDAFFIMASKLSHPVRCPPTRSKALDRRTLGAETLDLPGVLRGMMTIFASAFWMRYGMSFDVRSVVPGIGMAPRRA